MVKAAIERNEATWKEVLGPRDEFLKERRMEAYKEEKRKVKKYIKKLLSYARVFIVFFDIFFDCLFTLRFNHIIKVGLTILLRYRTSIKEDFSLSWVYSPGIYLNRFFSQYELSIPCPKPF